MNAIAAEADFTFDHAALRDLKPGVPDAARYNGWTAEKQKRFLTALSLGHPIAYTPTVSPAAHPRPAGSPSAAVPPRTPSSAAAR